MVTSQKEALLEVSRARDEIQGTVQLARKGGYLFLIYLLAMVLEELANIEHGRPTEL